MLNISMLTNYRFTALVPSSNFEQSLGFMLSDVSRLLRRDFDRRVRELALTQAQWRAIAQLSREDGIRQTTLAERLEVQPITLARLIDRMQSAGWVSREPDPDDRRATLLFLTEKAQPILALMRSHAEDALAEVLAGVSPTARKSLMSTLIRIKENLAALETASNAVSSGRIHTQKGSKRHV